VKYSTKTDGSDQLYSEVLMNNGEFIRVTFIENGWSDQGAVRIQIQQEDKHLRQGPEIPLENIPELFGAITQIILKQNEKDAPPEN
jgi:hypothetical protein